jgi:hypothetical protein
LDVYYNDNGTFTISAIDSSTNYKGSAIKCISTTIVATPSDCKLENVGDTILISAKLSGL